jgi:hypothetical protein
MRGNWIAAAILIGVAGAEARAQPAFVQVGEIAGPVDVVRAEGAMVYASAGRTLTVYDVADPSAPRQRGSYTFPQEIWSFRVAGSVVYAGVNFYGLGVLDVSDPATPALRSAFKTRGQAKTGAVFGTRAIVVDHMEGLVLVDLSTPAVPTSPGAFFVDGYARDVTTVGRHAFAVDSPTGFYVLDLSKADPLEPVASVQSGAALRALEVEGSLAVLVGGGALHPFDVTNPAAPVKHPPFRTPAGARGRPARGPAGGGPVFAGRAGGRRHLQDGRCGAPRCGFRRPGVRRRREGGRQAAGWRADRDPQRTPLTSESAVT